MNSALDATKIRVPRRKLRQAILRYIQQRIRASLDPFFTNQSKIMFKHQQARVLPQFLNITATVMQHNRFNMRSNTLTRSLTFETEHLSDSTGARGSWSSFIAFSRNAVACSAAKQGHCFVTRPRGFFQAAPPDPTKVFNTAHPFL